MNDERPYTCSYQHDGRTFGITVYARSFDEASAQLRSIGQSGIVEGELMVSIPVKNPFGWPMRFIKWVRRVLGEPRHD